MNSLHAPSYFDFLLKGFFLLLLLFFAFDLGYIALIWCCVLPWWCVVSIAAHLWAGYFNIFYSSAETERICGWQAPHLTFSVTSTARGVRGLQSRRICFLNVQLRVRCILSLCVHMNLTTASIRCIKESDRRPAETRYYQ